MDRIKNTRSFMRIVHRYLGYFMAGIMMVYAVSGVLLIYRDTDYLRKDKKYDKVIEANLNEKQLKKAIKIKELDIKKQEGDVLYFKSGSYDKKTGRAIYTKKELPFVLDKMVKLHQSKSADKFSPLNVFFGVCLFFFVISSFWMFPPKSKIFRKGLIYTAVGLVVAILLLMI